jgi:hypothetical protein
VFRAAKETNGTGSVYPKPAEKPRHPRIEYIVRRWSASAGCRKERVDLAYSGHEIPQLSQNSDVVLVLPARGRVAAFSAP